MSNKTVVVAPAIKVRFWKDIYKSFCKSKVPFHLVFVGHVKPDFSLPDNFTYIDCSLGAAECAEIAYRYAYKHITDARYIINVADDAVIAPLFLDKLIAFYESQVKKYNNDFLCVSSMFNGHFDEENLMAYYDGGPVLLGQMLTTVENSKKIGGADRRFRAIYWDCDRHLRAHEAGANVIFAPVSEVPPSKEGEYSPDGGLWNKFSKTDHGFLKQLWSVEEGGESDIFCSRMKNINGRPTNTLTRKKIKVKRKDKVIEYDDFYLGKYYE